MQSTKMESKLIIYLTIIVIITTELAVGLTCRCPASGGFYGGNATAISSPGIYHYYVACSKAIYNSRGGASAEPYGYSSSSGYGYMDVIAPTPVVVNGDYHGTNCGTACDDSRVQNKAFCRSCCQCCCNVPDDATTPTGEYAPEGTCPSPFPLPGGD